jgi:TrmH RNA methyltransferase
VVACGSRRARNGRVKQHAPGERSEKPRPREKRENAERVYGVAAALAAFGTRPEAVLSIAYAQALRHPLAQLLKDAARRRIAYREVDTESLTRMAQSVHHEGVCLLLRPRVTPSAAELLKSLGEHGLVLALDGVQNPHNIGAILRSAAYFGMHGMVYANDENAAGSATPTLSAAARRVAEGGAEYLPALGVTSLADALREAKRHGLVIIGSDARASVTAASYAWPQRALLVLGHEQHGMTRPVREQCDQLLRIDGPGAQRIDSLNVSVAAGIFMASYAASAAAKPSQLPRPPAPRKPGNAEARGARTKRGARP